jgi:hypothetical protein
MLIVVDVEASNWPVLVPPASSCSVPVSDSTSAPPALLTVHLMALVPAPPLLRTMPLD